MGLTEFLEHYKSNKKSVSHTSIGGGKWDIPASESPLFYKLIRKAHKKGEVVLPITEKIGDVHPLIFDLDLKFEESLTTSPLTEECYAKILEFLWKNTLEFVDIQDECRHNEAYVMLKSKPYPCSKGKYKSKDGIHVLFPNIILKNTVYKLICNHIRTNQDELFTIFKNTCEVSPSNLDDTLLDGHFTRWMPYTCYKENEVPYLLEFVYNLTNGEAVKKNPILVTGEMSTYTDELIMNQMSMFRENLDENVEYTEECSNKLKTKAPKQSKMDNSCENDIYATYYVDNNNIINPYQIVEQEELSLITNLCDCLSVERASEYGKWLDVGLALHNTNSEKLLPVWEKFSMKYHKYRDGTTKRNCADKWASFNNGHAGSCLTQGSLRYWANQDDPVKFNKVMVKNLGSDIEKSVTNGPEAHQLIAKVIHRYYMNQFVCIDISDDWYFFNGIRWKRTLKANELKRRIHNDIYNIYREYHDHYTKLSNAEDDADEQEKWTKKQKKCLTFMQKLLQENYVNTVISALRHLFYEENVVEQFDSNLNLLGLENGVIDLKEWVFREGRPEDYITKSNGLKIPVENIELPIKLSEINQHLSRTIANYDMLRSHLNDFIQQIIPDPVVREYTVRFLAKCLSGENRDEGFYIWTGSGGNGKSKLIELANLTLGDYSGGLPVSLITGKRASSNSATPEMERTKGLRLVVMQEPEQNESINIGLMKELTGNDKIVARGLFKEPIEFVPQYKLVLMCNDLPNIPSNDDGTWRRLEVVDFVSRFVGEEDYHKLDDSKHVYKRDKELRNKLPAWKIVFFGILLEEWMKYDKQGIVVPAQVRAKTMSYRNENDIVGQWIGQCCVISPNQVDDGTGRELAPTSFTDLFYEFKGWCTEQGYKPPDKKKTKDELLKWQEKSKYGLLMGQNMKEGKPNGSVRNPYFNLKAVEDE